jgi:flagellar hook assembly protein FlgD
VRTLARHSVSAGVTFLDWDLRDDRGEHVPPGIYFVRATAGRAVQTRRLVVTGGR